MRIAFNEDDAPPRKPLPPPPRTEPALLEALGVPLRAIPGERDLMHHKFVVRDGAAVWTGSTNWTLDSWTREENVLRHGGVLQALAAAYARAFEDLWCSRARRRHRATSTCRPWTSAGSRCARGSAPGRGPELSQRIAKRIAQARRRVRIASPVLTAAPILGTLNEVLAERRVDVAGVVGRHAGRPGLRTSGATTRTRAGRGRCSRASSTASPGAGKLSTPYAPGSVHDYMHAKVTVADDVVFTGSFNLSRSGEENAENVLEIVDAALADRIAAFVDDVRVALPAASCPRAT